jgi:hypothetical protein
MRGVIWLSLGCALLVAFISASAEACGALVTRDQALVLQAQQRVLISVRTNNTTNIVVELAIPSADAPFGALTPVGAQPTVEPEPVDVAEMDQLESSTRPVVEIEDPDSGGCSPGCGSAGDVRSGGERGVSVVQVVDVGPVTAVVLSADSTAPLAGWLTQNGFVIPAAQQSVVDAYVGPGKFFIAFKRSAQAPAGPSSVGVSFSVPGDMRGYPLAMSRIGSASPFSILVFVAAPSSLAPRGSAPSAPFAALTLNDFAAGALAGDYRQAVFEGVRARASKAFVLEGVFSSLEPWRGRLGPRLTGLTDSGQVLTRLVTVVAPETLDQDVSFLSEPPANVPKRVLASASSPSASGPRRRPQPLTLALVLAVVACMPLRRAGRRRSASNSCRLAARRSALP